MVSGLGRHTPGTNVGTAGYMAPEMMNEASYGTPADVYAFGLFLYEVLTKMRAWTMEDMSKFYRQMHPEDRRTFDEKTDMATIVSVLNHANSQGLLPNLDALDQRLTGGAKSLVRSCLNIDPGKRPLAGPVTYVIRNNLAVRLAPLNAATV